MPRSAILLSLCILLFLQASANTSARFPASFHYLPVSTTSIAIGHPSSENASIFHTGYRIDEDSLRISRLHRKAKWAKWLGIGSLFGLIIPFVNLLSLPAAITALVLAGQVKRNTNESHMLNEANRGRKTATATIAFLIVIAFISGLVILLESRGVVR